MKICCLSDQHGYLPDLSNLDFDVLLIAGDIVPTWAHKEKHSAMWLDTNFRKWLNSFDQPVIVCSGNHDFIFQNRKDLIPKGLKWTYLEDNGVEFNGFKIWGSPWQPVFYDWAFNLTEPELKIKWDMIPDDIDILITHGPPRGYGDWSTYSKEHVGSYTLLNRIKELKNLKLHLYGHIHSGFGLEMMDKTYMVNASYVGEDYKPANPPIIIEI